MSLTLILSSTAPGLPAQPNSDKTATLVPLLIEAPVQPDYDRDVLEPLHKAQAEKAAAEKARLDKLQSDCEATGGSLEGETCILPPPPPPAPVAAPVVFRAPANSYTGLMGTYGYASPYGNCVNEPGVNNPGWGNPIDWPITSTTPWIGATFLFWTNHTGVVTGIWDNGDIEVRHQNFQGGQTRFPASMFRGYR